MQRGGERTSTSMNHGTKPSENPKRGEKTSGGSEPRRVPLRIATRGARESTGGGRTTQREHSLAGGNRVMTRAAPRPAVGLSLPPCPGNKAVRQRLRHENKHKNATNTRGGQQPSDFVDQSPSSNIHSPHKGADIHTRFKAESGVAKRCNR